MLHLKIGDQRVAIEGELLAQLILDSMPDFMRPGAAGGMREKAMRSGINGVLPILLGLIHEKIIAGKLDIPAPDMRSPAARENMIAFAVSYLLSTSAIFADPYIFELVGVPNDNGETHITGILAAAPIVVGGSATDCGCAGNAGVSPAGENASEHD